MFGQSNDNYRDTTAGVKCAECGEPALTIAVRNGEKIGGCAKHPERVAKITRATSRGHDIMIAAMKAGPRDLNKQARAYRGFHPRQSQGRRF